jgi:hypothetical protein
LKEIVSIVTLLLLTGCIFSDDSTNEKKKDEASSSKYPESSTKLKFQNKQSIAELKLNRPQKSLNINGSKMIASEFPIIKGTKIFNTGTNSYAKVLGAIVVVLNNGITIDILNKGQYKIKEIASNTYRLTPQDNDTDVYELYKLLLENSEVSRVELSLFYSSIKEREEM